MKYKIGMYGGAFNPLHLGHVNNIIMASNQCEKLYVVLSSTNNKEEIPHKERLMWLKNITEDMENVTIFEMFDDSDSKEKEDWNKGARYIKEYINQKIDVVFAGNDYKEKNIWERLYPESEIVYFKREEINISSTMIRKNPYKYFDYLPNIVKQYYTKKVCIIGTESSGKSTLVRNLAKVFNTTYTEEIGRNICLEAGGIDNMQHKHYFEILFEHKKREKETLKNANKVLFIDTDSLTTLYFYNETFKEKTKENKAFNDIATNISVLNDYDLYIFLEPDTPWIQDGTRIKTTTIEREKNNNKLKKLFESNNIKYKVIKGTYQERYTEAKKICLALIN